jgi:nucleotide-binding universal stress UspA family protein
MEIAIKKICVASDFSSVADIAIHYGGAFAKLHRAELHLMHVVQNIKDTLTHSDFTADGEMSRDYFRQMRSDLPEDNSDMQKTKAFLASLESSDTNASELSEASPWWEGLTIIKAMRYGDPVEQICHYAKLNHIDLLIVGTHGKTGIRHLLMGSVAERVVRQSPCPVLTVRAHEHDFLTKTKP